MVEQLVPRPPPGAVVSRFRPRMERFGSPLYPLFVPLTLAGLVAGLVASLVLRDFIFLPAVAILFSICGATWRSDMPPVLPFCFAYQWIAGFAGYAFYKLYGFYPGGGDAQFMIGALTLQLVGFCGLAIGLRLGFSVFSKTFRDVSVSSGDSYDLRKLTILTAILFISSYIFNFAAENIWFGILHIVRTISNIRYVPYFLLIIATFQQKSSLSYLYVATSIVMLPQVLTGFSDFKEILFIILIAALIQWRPWVRSREQARQNRTVLTLALLGSVAIVGLGLLWQGGVKPQWRSYVWAEGASDSPTVKMGKFVQIVGDVTSNFDGSLALESLVSRTSSSTLYFSYVVSRVPEQQAHENGLLLQKAITNAVVPRFLFPEKANLGGDSWMVRTYAGIDAAGDESGTSIGLGYMPEFYIDFGAPGVFILCILYGLAAVTSLFIFAVSAPSREIFIALSIGILMPYFLALDGSFIKLFAGLIQQTIIVSVVVALLGRPMTNFVKIKR